MHVHRCYKLNFAFLTRTLSVLQSQNEENVYQKEFQKKLKLEMLFHLGTGGVVVSETQRADSLCCGE